MNYAVTQLKAMPQNESACNYLLGLISPLPNAIAKQDINVAHARLISVRNAIEDLIDNDKDGAGESPPILSLLVHLFHFSLQNRLLDPSPYVNLLKINYHRNLFGFKLIEFCSFSSTEDKDVLKEIADSAMLICDRLSLELDRIRANYWKYRKSQIKDAFEKII